MTTTETSHADSLDAEQEGYKQSLGSRHGPDMIAIGGAIRYRPLPRLGVPTRQHRSGPPAGARRPRGLRPQSPGARPVEFVPMASRCPSRCSTPSTASTPTPMWLFLLTGAHRVESRLERRRCSRAAVGRVDVLASTPTIPREPDAERRELMQGPASSGCTRVATLRRATPSRTWRAGASPGDDRLVRQGAGPSGRAVGWPPRAPPTPADEHLAAALDALQSDTEALTRSLLGSGPNSGSAPA